MDGKGQPRRESKREREGERELKFRCAPLLETLTGSFCSAVARGHSDYVLHGGPPPPPAPPFFASRHARTGDWGAYHSYVALDCPRLPSNIYTMEPGSQRKAPSTPADEAKQKRVATYIIGMQGSVESFRQ